MLQIPKPALLKGVGMGTAGGAAPSGNGGGYSRGGSVEFEGPSSYGGNSGGNMPEGGGSPYMGGERHLPDLAPSPALSWADLEAGTVRRALQHFVQYLRL